MAAFNFPNSPSTNDIHTENGVSWKWNGTVWKKIASPDTLAKANSKVQVVDAGTGGYITAETDGTQRLRVQNSGAIVTGILTSTTFVGALTGNVTGNVSGTSAGLTGTPAITVGAVTANTGQFSGNVNILGTLTYEDVKNVDSVGIITARDDIKLTATEGKVEATGATGLTLNASHGSAYARIRTAGSERLRITSDGYVRIGGNEGNYQLVVIDESNRTNTAETQLNLYAKHDGSGNTGVGFGGGIRFWGDRNGDNAEQNMGRIMCIADVNSGTNISGALTFDTASAGSSSEKMRISSSGLIWAKTRSAEVRRMILSGSPSNASFNIEAHDGESGTSSGDVQGKLGLFYNDGTTLTNTACISFERGSGAPDGAMAFVTNQAEKLRITSAGNVGINDSNPTNQLVVKAPGGSGHTTARVESGDASTTMVMQAIQGSEGRLGMSSNHPLAIYAGTTERLRIDSAGDVGINQNNPTAKLHIVEATSTTAVKIKSGTNSNQNTHITLYNDNDVPLNLGVFGSAASTVGTIAANTAFMTSNSVGGLAINASNASGIIKFGTGSSEIERLRITSGGQVIQTTTHTAGNSAHQNSGWYGDDANHYDLELRDFNELYAKKSSSTNDYDKIVYRRETMTSWCDIEFDLAGNAPSGTYRHFGMIINGDGSDTSANMDRVVYRVRPGSQSSNQFRIDKGGGGTGFNSQGTHIPNIFDGNYHHVHLQIRGREFALSINGVKKAYGRTDDDLVRSHGFFGFTMYESSSTNPWFTVRDFKIKNYTEKFAMPNIEPAHEGDSAIVINSGQKWGKMTGKRIHTGSDTDSTAVNILQIDEWQSTNSRIIVKVEVMAISPVSEIGFFAFGSGYCRRGSSSTTSQSHVVNSMEMQQRFGNDSSYGSISWSGSTLRYNVPSVAYIDLHVNAEWHAYDGAIVSFDTTYRSV